MRKFLAPFTVAIAALFSSGHQADAMAIKGSSIQETAREGTQRVVSTLAPVDEFVLENGTSKVQEFARHRSHSSHSSHSSHRSHYSSR